MKYSDIKGKLIACSTYRYTRCVGLGTTVDGRSEKHVYLDHYQYNENTRITQSFKPFMTPFYGKYEIHYQYSENIPLCQSLEPQLVRGSCPPFLSKIPPFLEIQDVPTFFRLIGKIKVPKDSFNRLVDTFYPQSILILEEYLQKWLKCKPDIMPLSVFLSIL